jgi:hypothetical protein
MPYLNFISDNDLIVAVNKVVGKIEKSEHDADHKLYKNVIDPFSALFHGVTYSISCKEWLIQERVRQSQKTMQNAIGDFHQEILGSIAGWKNLGVGGGLDVINMKAAIIAEIKNKFNTTKGNHKVEVYDAIKMTLEKNVHKHFTGYFVEIIPQGKHKYDKPFTPSDNKTKKRRPTNNKIRVIDGVSFYSLATGRKFALQELFEVLPRVISENHTYNLSKTEITQYFELFKKAFSTE